MINLVRSEYRKLTSTQVWFWMFMLAVGLTALNVIVTIAANDEAYLQRHVRDVFSAPQSAYIGCFVVAILGITTEYRYQTITPTLLATPSRWTLMTAKIIMYALVGLVYSLVCVVITLAVAFPWLNGKGVDFSATSNDVWGPLGGLTLAIVLFSLVGIGWGALIRSQIVGVTVGVIWLLIAEPLIFLIPGLRELRPYTPGGGLNAISSPHESFPGGVRLLGSGAGVAVVVVWAAIFAVGGAAYSMNRDIT